MTEDDTFNRLRRPAYSEMAGLYNAFWTDIRIDVNRSPTRDETFKFFKDCGWDINEYMSRTTPQSR